MKVSLNWLRELAVVDAGWDEIAERLTRAGLEVEEVTHFAGGFSGVVVAEIRDFEKHPDAENLKLVRVFDGREVVQVVCGAPVIPPAGSKVPWARPGARLGGKDIAARKIRGVESPGMLCAEDELGVSSSHEGLLVLEPDAAPGADVASLLADVILTLNVTPNRPDCLGHVGVAREIAALFPGGTLRRPVPSRRVAVENDTRDDRVTLDDTRACPRYVARVLDGAKVGKAPLRARLRLESLGVRAISDVVDATNLVLLEWGQPLHAFDLDKLAGERIVVRRARAGETIVTLDGQTRLLTAEDIVICDAEKPVALAGIMGGQSSEVTDATTRILLESAYFDATSIRRTARRLGLHTEASHRFERGADPNDGLALGSLRCASLLAEWCGATARATTDAYPNRVEPLSIAVRPTRVAQLLGTDIPVGEQVDILRRLELDPQPTQGEAHPEARIICFVPTWRPDLTREVDVIEEVARVHGYDKIAPTLPPLVTAPRAVPPDVADDVRDGLRALGLTEAVSFAFTSPSRIAALGFAPDDRRAHPVRIANPLGEEGSAMRTSLVANLLAMARTNEARAAGNVRLFEVGATFLRREPDDSSADARAGLPEERASAAGVLAGARDGWLKPGGELDFFDAKGIVEALLASLRIVGAGVRWHAHRGEVPWLHPGIGARILVDDRLVGAVGEVHPDVRKAFDLEARAFAFELDLASLGAARMAKFEPPPRFPGSGRDISFFIDADVPAADIEAVIVAASRLLERVRVVEDYREAGRVPAGKKGMLWSVYYRDRERTLTDEDVGREHDRVIAALKARFAIEQR